MSPDDPRWLQHLDVITAWGQASAANHTPPPTDQQLWAVSRVRADLNLPEQVDPALLDQLREAFNTGRQPTRIDLQALADALHKRGYDAVVEHTGGNTATLYAGSQFPDRHGQLRWSATAGPGWFEHPRRQRPFADSSEFAVGPDGDDTWTVTVPIHPGWTVLVNLIVAVIDEVNAQRARFSQAVEAAQDAMWATFAARYPEVTTGDLAPGARPRPRHRDHEASRRLARRQLPRRPHRPRAHRGPGRSRPRRPRPRSPWLTDTPQNDVRRQAAHPAPAAGPRPPSRRTPGTRRRPAPPARHRRALADLRMARRQTATRQPAPPVLPIPRPRTSAVEGAGQARRPTHTSQPTAVVSPRASSATGSGLSNCKLSTGCLAMPWRPAGT